MNWPFDCLEVHFTIHQHDEGSCLKQLQKQARYERLLGTHRRITLWWIHKRVSAVSWLKTEKKISYRSESQTPMIRNIITYCFIFYFLFRSSSKPQPAASNATASKFSQKFGSSDRCPRCSKAVYAAEKVMGAGKVRTGQRHSDSSLAFILMQFCLFYSILCPHIWKGTIFNMNLVPLAFMLLQVWQCSNTSVKTLSPRRLCFSLFF